MTRHVVNFSGGACSYVAAKRVVASHGAENVTLLFANVRMEDADLYRFLIECSGKLSVPVTVIQDGRTPWDVFFDERFLGNSRVDPCSKLLKRKLLDRWHRNNCTPSETVICVGLSWDEGDRLGNFQRRMAPWTVEAPLYEEPYLTKCEMLQVCKDDGIEPPALYKEGFPHNNCGGFCVKAGQAQFALLLKRRPETYAFHENKEQDIRAELGDVSIMRDRRGGQSKPLTMKAFRERIEANEQYDIHDWGGCGCAIE